MSDAMESILAKIQRFEDITAQDLNTIGSDNGELYNELFNSTIIFMSSIPQAKQNGKKDKLKATLQLLLDHTNVDIKQTDLQGNTYLHMLSPNGEDDLIEFLIQNGIDVNTQNTSGKTALHRAAEYGNISAAEIFIDSRANVNIQDEYGSTPLHLAARDQHDDMVQLLIKNGADPKIKTKDELSHKKRTWALVVATPALCLVITLMALSQTEKLKQNPHFTIATGAIVITACVVLFITALYYHHSNKPDQLIQNPLVKEAQENINQENTHK